MTAWLLVEFKRDVKFVRNISEDLKNSVAGVLSKVFIHEAEAGSKVCMISSFYEPKFPIELLKEEK